MVINEFEKDENKKWFLSYCHIHKYSSKDTLIYQGAKSDTLFYIIEGTVSVLLKDEEGKEIVLSYLNPGEFFGEIGLFENFSKRTAWIKTRSSCKIAEISYKKFHRLIPMNVNILIHLSKQMAERIKHTSEKVKDLAFLDVTGRISQTLFNLAKHPEAITHPDGMQIKITRQEIGRIVGCSRETVGRVLKKLENKKVISARGKTIVIYGTR